MILSSKAVLLEVGYKRTPKNCELLKIWAKYLKIWEKWRAMLLDFKKWRPGFAKKHKKTFL